MPVVKDIPLSSYFCHPAVIVAWNIRRKAGRLLVRDVTIAIADNDSAIHIFFRWIPADRITQFMHFTRRIDKIIRISILSD